MDTVTILRQLWRFRFLVIVVALVSVFAGLAVTFKLPSTESRKYEVGVATARLLLDTPASQVVDVAPKGSDVLGARATLLANLMVDGEIKTAIARQAGVSPAKLAGLNDSAQVAATAPLDPRGFQIGTKVLTATGGDSLPIIEVDAQAPTAAGAEKLANAAITGLRSYLDAKAVAEHVPDEQRLRVSGLGVAQGRLVTRGPRSIFAVAAALLLFAFGCGTILAVSAVVRGLRADQAPPPGPPSAPERDADAAPTPREPLDVWLEDEVLTAPTVANGSAAYAHGASAARADGSAAPRKAAVEPAPPPVDPAEAAKSSGSWWDRGPA